MNEEIVSLISKRFPKDTHKEKSWKISKSFISGRGVFLTKDVEAGDVIFVDTPIVYGPRISKNCEKIQVCVQCHRKCSDLKECEGCALPVCFNCANKKDRNVKRFHANGYEESVCDNDCSLNSCVSCEKDIEDIKIKGGKNDVHDFECSYLKKLKVHSDASVVLKTIVAVRCLNLTALDKKIVYAMATINGKHQSFEVDILMKLATPKPSQTEEAFMRRCCCVMDANAYAIVDADNESHLRGLYSLASVMNHCCIPNTFCTFDPDYRMVCKAAVSMGAGTELTATYSPLLLGTPARRSFLAETKHFACTCHRCADPTENGTFLSALRCTDKTCRGFLLSVHPLNYKSQWKCVQCGKELSSEKIGIMEKILASRMKNMKNYDLPRALEFLRSDNVAALSNHACIQIKFNLIKILGDGNSDTLTNEHLSLKKQYCEDVLGIADKLGLGLCRLKGICCRELLSVLMEIDKRSGENEYLVECLKIRRKLSFIFLN